MGMSALSRDALEQAKRTIILNHYAHSWPSGKSWAFDVDGVIVVFSLPTSYTITRSILGGKNGAVLELSRLWAMDGHAPNALSKAVSSACRFMLRIDPNVAAFVSYADPNNGHHWGGISGLLMGRTSRL